MSEKEYRENLSHTQQRLTEGTSTDNWRLAFHLMPETGWMNDPNGLCQFNGVIHFYHQYVPQKPDGSDTPHWGHKTSKDYLSFKEEPIFLSPENEYDQNGVYSGSAIVVGEEIHFFYTGNVKHPGDHEYTFSGREQNTVHVVSKDGYTIEKQEVVIPHSAYPSGFTNHIRDPKVFAHAGQYYMLLGARSLANEGKVLIFESNDLSKWTYRGIFFGMDYSLGYMWECPDYFQIDGRDVLLFSPQGVASQAHTFQNVYQSGYLIGEVDWDTLTFNEITDFVELDHGFDFYAPQTFVDEQNRRVLWAWMGLGDISPAYSNPTVARGWQHAATLPRQLRLLKNKLVQKPLKEFEALRGELNTAQIKLSTQVATITIASAMYELIVTADQPIDKLKINLIQDTELEYDGEVFTLTHGLSGYGRKKRSVKISGLVHIQIFVDTSSIEIFLNEGQNCLTSRVYPKQQPTNVYFEGNGEININYWSLEIKKQCY